MYHKKYHIHFVGIGGIGMSGIAELLLNLGYRVSGSDLSCTKITKRLETLGGTIYKGHNAEQVAGADVVVTSSAIVKDNCEVLAARKQAIPVIPRAEMLAELMRLKYSVAISGAHGKTSTTSIVGSLLGAAGLDPTIVNGGILKGIGTNAVLGKGDYIVAEADESDGSFLKFSPTLAVVTNIDLEHLDFYKDLDDIKEVFLSFLDRIPFYGLAILCLDNEAVQDILPKIKKRYTTYGITAQADLQAKNIIFDGPSSTYTVYHHGKRLGEIGLSLPGIHNVYNSLAGIAVGIELSIPFNTIKSALENLEGVQRRLEVKGEVDNIRVMDDYGHHPTEIKTTLTAMKESWPEKRVVVAFQPHRYTRTKALFDDFSRSFYHSDSLVVLPVYAASEQKIEGVNSAKLADAITAHGHKDVQYMESFDECVAHFKETLKKDDILITLGAGDVWKLGEMVLSALTKA